MNYVNYTEDKVHSIREYGFFYPTIAKNPGRYIERRDDFVQMVEKLRAQGKKTFIATNAHADYLELIMVASMGEGW